MHRGCEMNEHEKEAHRASREAERDLTAHPERTLPHVSAITRFVGANVYDETRPRKKKGEAGKEKGEAGKEKPTG